MYLLLGWSIIYSDICTCYWAGQLYIVIYVPVVGLVNYIVIYVPVVGLVNYI